MTQQITFKHSISCTGTGLHSGKAVALTLHPAEADTGIVFKRSDVKGKAGFIPARYDLVTNTMLGTTLTNKHGISISTIEHLMAALWGAGIDNAVIEVDAPEVPIMDGSSEPFLELIEQAGLKRLGTPRRILRVLAPVSVEEGDLSAQVEPYEGEDGGCSYDITIDFKHPLINCQRALYDFSSLTFKDTLSRARTFGFVHEVEYLRSQGRALGGSLENAIVLDKERILNTEGLRFSDEFIRHKALDCVGDLYLAGYRIEGHFTFSRPGHGINNKLLRALFADASAWKIVSQTESQPALPMQAALMPCA